MSFYPAKGGGKKKYKKVIVKTTSTDGQMASVDVTIDGKTTRYLALNTLEETHVGDNFYIKYRPNWNFWTKDASGFIYKDGDTIIAGNSFTWNYTQTKNYQIVKATDLVDVF